MFREVMGFLCQYLRSRQDYRIFKINKIVLDFAAW
jgi:hypothetical protein